MSSFYIKYPPPSWYFWLLTQLTRGGIYNVGAKIVCNRGVLKDRDIHVWKSVLKQWVFMRMWYLERTQWYSYLHALFLYQFLPKSSQNWLAKFLVWLIYRLHFTHTIIFIKLQPQTLPFEKHSTLISFCALLPPHSNYCHK